MTQRPAGELAAVFAGGVLGALARAGLLELAPYYGGWPWPTFAANVAGALLLGWVAVRCRDGALAFLGAGLCGALTTFSTMQLELVELLDAERTGLALGYAAASVAAGLAAVALGTSAARRAA